MTENSLGLYILGLHTQYLYKSVMRLTSYLNVEPLSFSFVFTQLTLNSYVQFKDSLCRCIDIHLTAFHPRNCQDRVGFHIEMFL